MQRFNWPLSELPRVAVAGRFAHFDRAHERHYQSPTHALHVYEYPCELALDGETFALEPGDLTVSPRGLRSSYAMAKAGHHLCVHFWPATSKVPSKLRCELPVVVRLGRRAVEVRTRLLEIARHHAQSKGQAGLRAARASALFLELLLSLVGDGAPGQKLRTRADFSIETACSWLDTHPGDELDVPALARRVGLSQNYLSRRFRQRYACTIPTYLVRRRIELSRQILEATELTVKEVAARVGIHDAQHFNKQFRRFSGESPSAYRDRVRTT